MPGSSRGAASARIEVSSAPTGTISPARWYGTAEGVRQPNVGPSKLPSKTQGKQHKKDARATAGSALTWAGAGDKMRGNG